MILKTIDGSELSKTVKIKGPIKRTGIQIKNKLLDGTDHIQVIGDSSRSISIGILADEDQCNIINYNQAMGVKVTFELEDKYYTCLIDARPEWERYSQYYPKASDRYYAATLNLLIQEEGNL